MEVSTVATPTIIWARPLCVDFSLWLVLPGSFLSQCKDMQVNRWSISVNGFLSLCVSPVTCSDYTLPMAAGKGSSPPKTWNWISGRKWMAEYFIFWHCSHCLVLYARLKYCWIYPDVTVLWGSWTAIHCYRKWIPLFLVLSQSVSYNLYIYTCYITV